MKSPHAEIRQQWEKETYRAYTLESVAVDPDQAEALLRAQLLAALEEQMDQGKVLQTDWEVTEQDGMLEVKLLAQCSEQIGRQAALHLPAQRPEASPWNRRGRSRTPEGKGRQAQQKGLPRKGRERRSMIEQTVSIERMEDAIDIFGSFDENIRIIEQELAVRVVSRDDQLKISGEEDEAVDQAAKVIQGLLSLSARGETIHEQNVRYLIQLVKSGNEDKIQTLAADVLCVTAKGNPSRPKPWAKKRYVDAIRTTPSPWGWARPAPARPTWRWPPRWRPSAPRRSTASS